MKLLWFLVSLLIGANGYFMGWNVGYDLGKETGKNEAIIEGQVKVIVECHFPCKEGRTR